MKFKTALDVANVIEPLKTADDLRSENRALINSLFNGEDPWSQAEADENNINVNVNFLDAAQIAHDARNTFNNAFLKPGLFFTVLSDHGPVHKRRKYSRDITKNINRIMKKSRLYMESQRAEFAQTVLHGVGPSSWINDYSWCPKPVAIGDLMIPGNINVDLENLEFFAIRRKYTPTRLYAMTHGKEKNRDNGWNMKMVDSLLNQAGKDALSNSTALQDWNPEQIVESYKSNLAYFDSESITMIECWDFYHWNEKDGKWWRKVIPAFGDAPNNTSEFLYEGKSPFADSRSEILHIMFADGANVAPFRYHSVRGLGWLLYSVCNLQNRLRCKFTDAAFEQMLWYFRVSNPEDQERLDKIDLHHLGVIPAGMDFVKAQDRYNLNQAIVESVITKNEMSMSRSAAQFRQGLDEAGRADMTAAEVMARVNSANALVGSMLNMAYTYQNYQYEEICRRFCKKGSLDKDVKEFWALCKKDGVHEDYLDVKKWVIEPERVLGSGNRTLEIAQADRLIAIRNLLDPESQREVLHMYVEANTEDHRLATRLVPMEEKIVSDSQHDAEIVAGTLMQGLPVSMKKGMNHIEYVEALLVSMSAVLKKFAMQQQMGQTASIEDLIGIKNIAAHIIEHLNMIAQDPNEKSRVKKYGDALGNFNNLIKGFEQRTMKKAMSQQGNGQMAPEDAASIKAQLIKAETNAKIKEAGAMQRMEQRQQQFQQKMLQDAETHNIEMGKIAAETRVDVASQDAKTAAEIQRENLKNAATQPERTV